MLDGFYGLALLMTWLLFPPDCFFFFFGLLKKKKKQGSTTQFPPSNLRSFIKCQTFTHLFSWLVIHTACASYPDWFAPFRLRRIEKQRVSASSHLHDDLLGKSEHLIPENIMQIAANRSVNLRSRRRKGENSVQHRVPNRREGV